MAERDADADRRSSAQSLQKWFHRRVPIWITEYGEQTKPQFAARRQLRAAGAATRRPRCKMAAASPYVEMFIWFTIQDSPATWQSGLLHEQAARRSPATRRSRRRRKTIDGQTQFVAPGKYPTLKVDVPFIAYHDAPGTTSASPTASTTARSSSRVQQLRDEARATTSPSRSRSEFKPAKGKQYTVERRRRRRRTASTTSARSRSSPRRSVRAVTSAAVGALAGKTAIVTGASSGIGAATARALAAEGARVVGGARRVERIETDVALELDVTDPASCERFVDAAGPVDMLVNAAGLALGRAPFDRVDRGGRAHRLRDERQRPRADDPARAPALAARAGPHRQHRLDRRPLGVSERRDATSPRSSPCAGSRARSARTCSAATSASRPSTPASSRPSSRSSASAATPSRRRPSTRARGRSSADDVARCVLFALTPPAHVVVDELVVMSIDQSSGARVHRR